MSQADDFSTSYDWLFVLEFLSSLYGNEASEERKGAIKCIVYASKILFFKRKRKNLKYQIIMEILQVVLTYQTQKGCCYSDFMDHHI